MMQMMSRMGGLLWMLHLHFWIRLLMALFLLLLMFPRMMMLMVAMH